MPKVYTEQELDFVDIPSTPKVYSENDLEFEDKGLYEKAKDYLGTAAQVSSLIGATNPLNIMQSIGSQILSRAGNPLEGAIRSGISSAVQSTGSMGERATQAISDAYRGGLEGLAGKPMPPEEFLTNIGLPQAEVEGEGFAADIDRLLNKFTTGVIGTITSPLQTAMWTAPLGLAMGLAPRGGAVRKGVLADAEAIEKLSALYDKSKEVALKAQAYARGQPGLSWADIEWMGPLVRGRGIPKTTPTPQPWELEAQAIGDIGKSRELQLVPEELKPEYKFTPKGQPVFEFFKGGETAAVRPTWGQPSTQANVFKVTRELYARKAKEMGIPLGEASTSPYFENLDPFTGFPVLAEKTKANIALLPYQATQAINKGSTLVQSLDEQLLELKTLAETEGVDGIELTRVLNNTATIPHSQTLKDLGRQFTDGLFMITKKAGRPIEYRQNYAPEDVKVHLDGKGLPERLKQPKPGAKPYGQFGPEMQREGKINPQNLQEDFFINANTRINQVRKMQFDTMAPDVDRGIGQLRMAGKDKEARMLSNWWKQNTGQDREGARTVFFSDVVDNGVLNVEKALKQAQIPPNKFNKALQSAKKMLYHTFVFGRAKQHILQRLQTVTSGDPLIGRTWRKKGEELYKLGKWKNDPLAMEARETLGETERNVMEMSPTEVEAQPPGIFSRTIQTLTKPVTKWFARKFMEREETNRMIMYLGSRAKMEHFAQTNPSEATWTLNPHYEKYVIDILKAKGPSAAAHEYGKIQSFITNIPYSIANRPEMLNGSIAMHFPFTTWTRHQYMRAYEDLHYGNYQLLARQLLIPAFYDVLFQLTTGYRIPGFQPMSALVGPPNLTPLPGMSEAWQELEYGAPLAAAHKFLGLTPAVGTIVDPLLRTVKKEDPFQGILGMRPSPLKAISLPSLIKGGIEAWQENKTEELPKIYTEEDLDFKD